MTAGACDLTHFSVPYVGLDGVQPLLLSRYALLLPAVLALRGALSSSQATARGNSVAAVCLLALPFCALLAVTRGRYATGLLYNARTGESEVCAVKAEDAMELLLDLAHFK